MIHSALVSANLSFSRSLLLFVCFILFLSFSLQQLSITVSACFLKRTRFAEDLNIVLSCLIKPVFPFTF